MENIQGYNLLASCYELFGSTDETRILLTDRDLIERITSNVSQNFKFSSPEVLISQVNDEIRINKTQKVEWTYLGSYKGNHIMHALVINKEYKYDLPYTEPGGFVTAITPEHWLVLQNFENKL